MIAKIGISNNLKDSRNIINEGLNNKKFKVEEEIRGDIYFFHIEAESRFFSKKDYYSTITNIIMNIIFNAYSMDILNKKICKERKDIKDNERDEITRLSREQLLDENNFKLEKNQIHNQIKEYIMENHNMYIDGFIQFRIKEFELFIDMVIDRGIDEFTLEKEYKEFIKILQYFVDVQESKYNLINIIFENNDYLLLDEEGNILDKDFFSEIVEEIEPGGISKDDLLIFTLIVLAPKKIFIHMDEINEKEELITIISSVFQDRVYFCFGCPKCNGETKIKRGK